MARIRRIEFPRPAFSAINHRGALITYYYTRDLRNLLVAIKLTQIKRG